MTPEFKFSATDQLKQLLSDFQQRVGKLPDELRKQIRSGAGSSAGAGGGGGGGGARSPAHRPGMVATAASGYQTGAQYGAEPTSDIAELQSGGFAGVVGRRVEAVKRFAEMARNRGGGMAGAGGGGRGMLPAGGAMGAAGGGTGGAVTFQRVTVQRMELSAAASSAIGRAIARGARAGGGGGFFGRGGGGGGGGFSLGSAAGAVGRSGSALPFLGAVTGAMGAIVGIVSNLGQGYQRVMQQQDSTLDALGGYVGGGGAVMQNEQLAQARLEQGKISGSRRRRGISGKFVEKATGFRDPKNEMLAEMKTQFVGGAGDYDLRFGQRMGIGGVQAGRMGAQIQRYSDDSMDISGKSQMHKFLQRAILAGFEGLRGGEFIKKVAQITEQAYMAGFGKVNVSEMTSSIGGLKGAGLRPERSFAVYQQMQQGFQQRGGMMQNLAIAAGMNKGQSYMQAMVGAEKGATKSNLKGVSGMLGLESMDPETRAMVESQLFGFTATEAMGTRKKGGLFGSAAKGPSAADSIAASRGASAELSGVESTGQMYRHNANVLSNVLADQSAAFQASTAAVSAFAKGMRAIQPAIKEISAGLTEIITKLGSAI